MIKYILIITGIVLFSACSNIYVERIQDIEKASNHEVIYVLPKTAIRIDVTVEKSIHSPGPYKKYASEYLGVSNTIDTQTEEWSMIDVAITEFPMPDTANYYAIRNAAGSWVNNVQLCKEGYLFSINNGSQEIPNDYNHFSIQNEKESSFTAEFEELPMKKIFKEQYDTTYSIVTTDTSTRRIPSYKKYLAQKSEKEMAKDAADFIVKLRKRRFKLMAGIYEEFPDGDAFNSMVAELNELEKEYLSLFMGQVNKQKYTFTYTFVPDGTKEVEKTVLFRFSKEDGMIEKSASKGHPILIECNNLKYCNPIDSLYAKNEKLQTADKGIVYRIPGRGEIKIQQGKHLLSQKSTLISQYGHLHAISNKKIKNSSVILFYHELGSLKSIKGLEKKSSFSMSMSR